MLAGVQVRLIDAARTVDVTAHASGLQFTTVEVGGYETASMRIDLPRSDVPRLDEHTRVVIADEQGRDLWEGFATDPGRTLDEDGDGFDLVATGTMVLASDRVRPLVYLDGDQTHWERASTSVESAQVQTTEGGGWRLAHPQGYPIGTGAVAALAYRQLEHATQGIGAVRLSYVCGTDLGYELQAWRVGPDGTVAQVATFPASVTPVTETLRVGTDWADGAAAVLQLRWVRTGGATNVTDALAWCDVTALVVQGARVDRYGTPVPPDPTDTTLTADEVVEDLIGRGMLASVDPDAAVVEDTGQVYHQLAFPDGVRGSSVLAALREPNPDVLWSYGPRTRNGRYAFTWAPAAETVRYDVTDEDALTRVAPEDSRCHALTVYYRVSETDDRRRSVTVTLDGLPDGARTREADPLVLDEYVTDAEAEQAGWDRLAELADIAMGGTATITRRVFDRARGTLVEPVEVRPGWLARIEETGELLRVTAVTVGVDDDGASAELTLGDAPRTVEDQLAGLIRGDITAGAPLIPPPAPPVPPVVTAAPEAQSDGQAPGNSPTPTILSGIGSLFITWEEISNTDPVIYDVYVSTASPVTKGPSTYAGSVMGTMLLVRQLPTGAALANNTTYYARIVARDADGEAPISAEASGTAIAKIRSTEITDAAISTPQLATNAVTSDKIAANQIYAGHIVSGQITAEKLSGTAIDGKVITGAYIQSTSAGNRGIKLDGWNNLLLAYDSGGAETFRVDGNTGDVLITGAVRTSAWGKWIEMGETGPSDPVDELRMWNNEGLFEPVVCSLRNPSFRPGSAYFSTGFPSTGHHFHGEMDAWGTLLNAFYRTNFGHIFMLPGTQANWGGFHFKDSTNTNFRALFASAFVVPASKAEYKTEITRIADVDVSAELAKNGAHRWRWNLPEGKRLGPPLPAPPKARGTVTSEPPRAVLAGPLPPEQIEAEGLVVEDPHEPAVGLLADTMPDWMRAGDGYSLNAVVAFLWEALRQIDERLTRLEGTP
ncbi:hypothetical protein [Nocardioides pakistanensis]